MWPFTKKEPPNLCGICNEPLGGDYITIEYTYDKGIGEMFFCIECCPLEDKDEQSI